MLTHPTLEKLHALKLHGMAAALSDQMATPDGGILSFDECLGLMIDRESTERNARLLANRLRRARLRHGAVLEQFPHAIQVVDLFLAKKRLWDVAHEAYGKASDTAAAWAHARCAELENEQFPKLQAALRVHARTHPEAKAAIGYFRNNKPRMRYKQFRQMGLVVTSGVVESGCKQVIGVRLKGSDRRWSVAGGNTIVALRSCLLSG